MLTKLAQWKQGFTDSARRKEQKGKQVQLLVFRHVLLCLLLMSSVNVNLWQKRTMRVMNLQGNAISNQRRKKLKKSICSFTAI